MQLAIYSRWVLNDPRIWAWCLWCLKVRWLRLWLLQDRSVWCSRGIDWTILTVLRSILFMDWKWWYWWKCRCLIFWMRPWGCCLIWIWRGGLSFIRLSPIRSICVTLFLLLIRSASSRVLQTISSKFVIYFLPSYSNFNTLQSSHTIPSCMICPQQHVAAPPLPSHRRHPS